MSECIYEIIDFPKYHRKNMKDFCPGRFYRLGIRFWLFSSQLYSGECITYLVWMNFQCRNLSNFFGGILENWWFHKYILTSSDLYRIVWFWNLVISIKCVGKLFWFLTIPLGKFWLIINKYVISLPVSISNRYRTKFLKRLPQGLLF